MAGTFAAKSLADGQLASSKGTLYTAPTSTTTYVKTIRVFNTGSTTETVIIYAKPGSTSRKIAQVVLAENEWAEVLDGQQLILPAAGLIEGQTTNATTVDYQISGVEET